MQAASHGNVSGHFLFLLRPACSLILVFASGFTVVDYFMLAFY